MVFTRNSGILRSRVRYRTTAAARLWLSDRLAAAAPVESVNPWYVDDIVLHRNDFGGEGIELRLGVFAQLSLANGEQHGLVEESLKLSGSSTVFPRVPTERST